MQFSKYHRCSMLAVLFLAFQTPGGAANADDQPAAPAPAAEAPALKFARHDAARWAERSKPLTDAAAAANAALEAANKAVADAKAAVVAADKAVADSTALVAASEQGKTAADKALADAQDALQKVETEKKDDQEALTAAKAT